MAAEKTYETKIKSLLKSVGAYNVKYFGCAYSQSGVPDLLCSINGRFVAIEVKAERGRPSALQLHNLRAIDKTGGVALLVYPKDFEQLKLLLSVIKAGEDFTSLYAPFRERFLP